MVLVQTGRRGMSLLFKIIYAAHANGTHHKLALDALHHLASPDAAKWTRVFLKHADVYMEGSKAPDTHFKDFKNHVLHVRDGYWGGAPEKALSWYGHLVDGLKAQDWERAVFAAGVLTHYVTDPIHPFHTAQTEAENNIHRAVEWSINRSYDSLRREAEAKHSGISIAAVSGDHWLKDLVCQGAETSNRSYELLIAHYDIHRGVVAPPEGLDGIARAAVSELLMIAAKTVAVALDHAFAEAGVAPPEVSLSAATVLATLKIPLKFVTKKIDHAETRRQVEAMYDELKTTGKVEINLPADDRQVRDLHAAEVLAPRAAKQAAIREARLPASGAATPIQAQPPARARPPAAKAGTPKHDDGGATNSNAAASKAPLVAPASAPAPPPQAALSQLSRPSRLQLSLKDNLEAAPSIGPKMAERFAALGISTVGDFVSQNVKTMAELLADPRLTPEHLLSWQHQSRMVMAIPGLTGTQAQLLTGAGLSTANEIAAADPISLSAAVMKFATSSDGKRILRDGNPPDLEKIKDLVGSAARAMAA